MVWILHLNAAANVSSTQPGSSLYFGIYFSLNIITAELSLCTREENKEAVTPEEGEDVSLLPSHYQSRDWLLAE